MSSPADGAPAAAGRLSDDIRGALFMIAGGLSFTAGGVAVKQLGGSLPEPVVMLGRHVFALACFLPWLIQRGPAALRTSHYWGHLYRGAFGFLSFWGFVYALPRLPLADTTALTFTTPLWSMLLSMLILAEPPRLGRSVATLVGFGGVLIVARPTAGFQAATLAAAGAAMFTSLAMMKVKQLSVTEPPDRIAFYFMFNGLLIAVPLAVPVWVTPDPVQLLLLAATGLMSFLGQICLSRGYALGQFTLMAPMDFFRLPFAILVGFLLFAEMPDLTAVLGMAVIVGASLYILLARRPRRS